MDLLLAICQAIGLALAVGIGGVLAALFIAVMASADAGIDLRGTDWEFIGDGWFIAILFAANVLAFYESRRPPQAGSDPGRLDRRIRTAAAAGVLGALFGAASLAEQGEPAAIGFVLGALFGAGSATLAGEILAGAQRRAADAHGAASTLELIFGAAGIATAALALFVPPASLLALIGLLVVGGGRRRRAGEKYEGLRVLR
jgi:hypothetical protein